MISPFSSFGCYTFLSIIYSFLSCSKFISDTVPIYIVVVIPLGDIDFDVGIIESPRFIIVVPFSYESEYVGNACYFVVCKLDDYPDSILQDESKDSESLIF